MDKDKNNCSVITAAVLIDVVPMHVLNFSYLFSLQSTTTGQAEGVSGPAGELD